ncbi:hypothetical protein L6452_20944 [Arctium lappa]|uniref:Uncharacterized protein n=1 Tax=Arctium lappa TaxID=4217 RepID=A0ACB9BC01_ARCLA|nr:hypothetical protein L6452_20944 [Arctium lappa]
MPLKRRSRDEFRDDFRPIKRYSEHGIKEPNDQEDSTSSSVGSNYPIHELIIISDDDGDEVESPPSTVNGDDDDEVESPPSRVNDVSGDEWRETKGAITVFESPAASGEKGSTEKKGKEEEGDLWVKYGSMIVDDNGFLLGEFRRLDEDLYMNIMID